MKWILSVSYAIPLFVFGAIWIYIALTKKGEKKGSQRNRNYGYAMALVAFYIATAMGVGAIALFWEFDYAETFSFMEVLPTIALLLGIAGVLYLVAYAIRPRT